MKRYLTVNVLIISLIIVISFLLGHIIGEPLFGVICTTASIRLGFLIKTKRLEKNSVIRRYLNFIINHADTSNPIENRDILNLYSNMDLDTSKKVSVWLFTHEKALYDIYRAYIEKEDTKESRELAMKHIASEILEKLESAERIKYA